MRIHVTSKKKKTKFKVMEIEDAFGDSMNIVCEIGETYKKGYNHKSGSWGISKLSEDDTPAEFMTFREKRKRKWHIINKNRVIRIRDL